MAIATVNPATGETLKTFDALSDDERAQEIEDAMNEEGHSWVLVPNELIREVEALIARRKSE